MKKISKVNKSKKGFTLLETMLSVCIMVIISSMLLNGFLATMGFSYHTSVYSKSGATNYDKCMSEISGYQSLDVDTRNVTIGNLVATGGESVKISFKGGTVAGASIRDIKAYTFDYNSSTSGMDATIKGVASEVYTSESGDDGVYVDNRTGFFYYPTVNAAGDGSHLGKIHLYYDNDNNKIVWGYIGADGKLVTVADY